MVPSWAPIFLLCVLAVRSTIVDKTIEVDAKGEGVVIETVQLLRDKGIVGQGHDFLMKLAFVETNFGLNITKPNTRGIWQFTEEDFKYTKSIGLSGIFRLINKNLKPLNIRWRERVKWDDLRKPLYGALAVHLYCATARNKSKTGDGYPITLEKQAEFRDKHYTPAEKSSINSIEFQRRVEVRESKKVDCKMDVVVLLDGSVSISRNDFITAKEFVVKFFAEISNQGKNRLGLVLYSDDPYIIIDLGSDKSGEMNKTILEIEHPNGQTYTNDGLRTTFEVFEASTHPAVKKALVIITDGDSTDGVTEIQNVQKLKITPFAVGVGNLVNRSELLELAGGDKFREQSLENYDELLKVIKPFYSDICDDPILVTDGIRYNQAVEHGESQAFRFSAKAARRDLTHVTKTNRTVKVLYVPQRGHTQACLSFCERIFTCERYDIQLPTGLSIIDVPANCSKKSTAARKKRSVNVDEELDVIAGNFDDYYNGGDELERDNENSIIPVYIVVVPKSDGESSYNLTFYETATKEEVAKHNPDTDNKVVHIFTLLPAVTSSSTIVSNLTYSYRMSGPSTMTTLDDTTMSPLDDTTMSPLDTTTTTSLDTTTTTSLDCTTTTPLDAKTMSPLDTTTMSPLDTTTMSPLDTTTMSPLDTTTITLLDNTTSPITFDTSSGSSCKTTTSGNTTETGTTTKKTTTPPIILILVPIVGGLLVLIIGISVWIYARRRQVPNGQVQFVNNEGYAY